MNNQSSANILQRMEEEIIKAEENARYWVSVAETIRGLRGEVTSVKDVHQRTLKTKSGVKNKSGIYNDINSLHKICGEVKRIMVLTGLTKTEACQIYAEKAGLGIGGPTLIGYLGKKVIGEKRAKSFNKVPDMRKNYLENGEEVSDFTPMGKTKAMIKDWGLI